MGALNVLGGIATGYNQSVEDKYRYDEQKFLQQQRQRMLKEQADSDITKAQLKGIRRPGEYEEEVSMPDMSGRGVTGGLDADAGDVKPVKTKVKRKYTEADQARDIAGVMQERGRCGAAAMLDRAHSLGERDYKQRAMDLIRASKSMSKSEFARQAAALKTAAADDVNAFTTVGENGEVATIYNAKTGEELQIPIQSHEQIARMVMSTLDPQLWVQTEKLGLDARQVASGEKVAGATEKRANTEANVEDWKMKNLYPAQMRGYDSETALRDAQRTTLLPAQVEAMRAETALRRQQGLEVSKRMQLIERDSKLDQGVRDYLQMLRGMASTAQAAAEKAAIEDPQNAGKYILTAKAATASAILAYEKHGGGKLAGINPWEAAGLPSPIQEANSYFADRKGNLNPADVEKYLMGLYASPVGQRIPQYVAEVRAVLTEAMRAQRSTQQGTPMGINQPATSAVPTTGSRWNQQNDTGVSQWLGGMNRP